MGDFEEEGSKTRRRSARQTSKTAFYSADPKPRPPLKRTRKMREDEGESTAVNGSDESKNLSEGDYGESPDKIPKLEKPNSAGDLNEKGDGHNNADAEMDEDEDQDQDMISDEETEQDHGPIFQTRSGTEDKDPVCGQGIAAPLSRRNSIHLKTPTTERPKTAHHGPNIIPQNLIAGQKLDIQQDLRNRNWKNKTNENPITHKGIIDTVPPSRSQPQKIDSYLQFQTQHYPKNLNAHYKNKEMKTLPKPVTLKQIPKVSSSKGWTRYFFKFFQWLVILIAVLALGWLAYQNFVCPHLPQTQTVLLETLDKFDQDLAALQAIFPNQRSVIWKRSRIHLKRHLEMVNPTEPVSVILTAGLTAERTLGCLARSLATVYSTSHNASILEISGDTKVAQDSDQVKLEIDEALKEAFEGDKRAAVVHHFEELPPGSTLIFYRYCDHEYSAFKKVFLVFTVMLSENDISPTASLSAVEDMVHDHLKEKFISSDKSAKFNQMDVDKMSGLWSRISHLILPVAAEEKIEQEGCGL